ncbi:Fic family protein [Streptomyces sp. NPDC000941]
MLYRTPHLAPVDYQVLEQVDGMREQLRHAARQVPMKWMLAVSKALTASAIAASNTIEGYRVDVRDVADLMDGEREVDASDEHKAETLAYQQAMTYIQSLHDVTDFRYSKELLNSLHWMLQGHHHPRKTAGQWRKSAIRITAPGDEFATDYEGPDHELVPGLMSELVDWLNEGDLDHHVLIRAAMAHLNTQQATRDLQALTKAELLTAVGQTKGRHYVAGPRFPQNVLATAQRRHTIVDPYAA